MSGADMCYYGKWSGLCVLCSLIILLPAQWSSGYRESGCKSQSLLCLLSSPSCWWLSYQGSLLFPSSAQITRAKYTRAGRGWWGQRDNRAGLVKPCKPLSKLWVLLWMWYFCQNDVEGRSRKRRPMFVPGLTSFSCPCPCPALFNMFPAGGERNQKISFSPKIHLPHFWFSTGVEKPHQKFSGMMGEG